MEVLDHFERAAVDAARARDELVWIDLERPSRETIDEVGALLGLHPLAIEDSENFGQRPKLDDYPATVLLVFFGACIGENRLPQLVEVHLHITATAIVTVRRTALPEFMEARQRVADRTVHSSEEAVYRVLHALSDSFLTPLRAMEDELDLLEDRALDDPDPGMRQRLLAIKHALLTLRQVVEPQRDLLASRRDVIEALPGFTNDDAHDYLRDVHDHLARTTQQIESVRELVANALDLYLSTVSNRLNEVMKRLTVVATIFLPLTFLTGFFGMNFGWMVDHITGAATFWLLGVGSSAGAGSAMWWFSARLERRREDLRRAAKPVLDPVRAIDESSQP